MNLIRFLCESCGTPLSAGARKAGTYTQCPRCRQRILVPRATDVAAEGRDAPEAERIAIAPDRVAVTRRALYLQGLLLGAVAGGAFLLGLVAGRGRAVRPAPDSPPPLRCAIRGVVACRQDGGEPVPNGGAVVIVLPYATAADERLELRGLLPQDPLPAEDDPAVAALRSIGGHYTRADGAGRFEVRVPDRGRYFLLAIAAGQYHGPQDSPRRVPAEIERFFRLTPELFVGQAFCWQAEQVDQDRLVNLIAE